MNETFVDPYQGRGSNVFWDRGNFVHDGNGTREYTTLPRIHSNDGPSRTVTPTRRITKEYRIRAAAISAGLFLSGIVFTVIQIVGK